jgi:hypothetical protein
MVSYSSKEFVSYLRSLMLSLLAVSLVLTLILLGRQPTQNARVNAYLEFLASLCYEHPGTEEMGTWLEDVRLSATKSLESTQSKILYAQLDSEGKEPHVIAVTVDYLTWAPAWSEEKPFPQQSGGSSSKIGPERQDKELPEVAKFEALWNQLVEPLFVHVPKIKFPLTANDEQGGKVELRAWGSRFSDTTDEFEAITGGVSGFKFSNEKSRQSTGARALEFSVPSETIEINVQDYLLKKFWPKSTGAPPSPGRMRESFPELYPYLPEYRHLPFADFAAQALKKSSESDTEIELLGAIKVPSALVDTAGIFILLGIHFYFAIQLRQFLLQKLDLSDCPPWLALYEDQVSVWTFRMWMLLPLAPFFMLIVQGRAGLLGWLVQIPLAVLLTGWIWHQHNHLRHRLQTAA